MKLQLTLAWCVWLCACTASHLDVVDGQLQIRQTLPPPTHAAYYLARKKELRGDWQGAEAGYRQLISWDEKASVPWTRLGTILCRRAPAAADQAFAKARALAPNSAYSALEEARCHLERSEIDAAYDAAQRAFNLSPLDSESNWILVETLKHKGEIETARRIAWGHAALHPTSQVSWMLLYSLPPASEGEALYVLSRLAEVTRGQTDRPPFSKTGGTAATPPILHALDQAWTARLEMALMTKQPTPARDASIRLGLSSLDLARRAYASGAYSLCLDEALPIHRIRPDWYEPWVLSALCADLTGNEPLFQDLVRRRPEPSTPIANELRDGWQSLCHRRQLFRLFAGIGDRR